MTITVNRDSVCMGDDVESHLKNMDFDGKMLLSELLLILYKEYLPGIVNYVWTVSSGKDIIGFITDEGGKLSRELVIPDVPLSDSGIESITFRHYYVSSFRWIDGRTRESVEIYPECATLFQKVKKQLNVI